MSQQLSKFRAGIARIKRILKRIQEHRLTKKYWRWYRPKRKLWSHPLAIHTSTVFLTGFIAIMGGLWLVPIFFGSLILHEYCHVWMAREFKIETKEVQIMGVGAAAIMDAGAEFLENGEAEMKIGFAGPVASAAIAAVCYVASTVFLLLGWQELAAGAAQVGVLNVVLGAWNMLPFYPMDGGRVLRGYLHAHHFTTWEEKAVLNKVFKRINTVVLGFSGGLIVSGLWLPAALLFGMNQVARREFKLTEEWIKARIGEQEYEAKRLFEAHFRNMRAISDAGRWWKPLGLRNEPATFAECKRAYRRKVLQVHPDRGGTKVQMQRVTAAYEIAKKAFKK